MPLQSDLRARLLCEEKGLGWHACLQLRWPVAVPLHTLCANIVTSGFQRLYRVLSVANGGRNVVCSADRVVLITDSAVAEDVVTIQQMLLCNRFMHPSNVDLFPSVRFLAVQSQS
jgi:hypothetical protein